MFVGLVRSAVRDVVWLGRGVKDMYHEGDGG